MCEEPMKEEHKEILCAALKACGLLDGNGCEPEVIGAPKTGQAGKSTVYRLKTPKGKSLVAKFDEAVREQKEWNAIEALRQIDSPPNTILPVHQNVRQHNVVIYQFAGAHASSGKVQDFGEFLKLRFFRNPRKCLDALDEVYENLRRLHNGTVSSLANGRTLFWRDVFDTLTVERAATAIDQIDPAWRQQCRSENNLPDPLEHLSDTLKADVGAVMVSQIHGDLNFSNVLFGLDRSFNLQQVFLIDLACWKPEAATAYDAAVMEMQFWVETWPKLCKAAAKSDTKGLDPFDLMLNVGQFFNKPCQLQGAQATVGRFIHRLRSRARDVLKGQAPDDYALVDYMTALYLNFLRALNFDTVKKSEDLRKIAYAGAALAVGYLEALQQGDEPYFPDEPAEHAEPPDPKAPAPMHQSLGDRIRSVFRPECGDSLSPCYVDPHGDEAPRRTAEVILFEGPENLGKTQKWLHWLNERQQNQRVPSFLCTKNTTSSEICQFLKEHAVRLQRAAAAGRVDAAVQGQADNNCWQNTALALSASNVRALAIQDVHKLADEELTDFLDASEILLRRNVTVGLESRQPLLINPAVRIHRKNFVPWCRTLIEQSLRLGEQRLSFRFADSATDALAKYCVGEPRALHALSQAFVIKYLKPRDTLANEVPEIGRSGTDAIVKEAEGLFLFDRVDGLKKQVDSMVKCWKRAKKWWDEDGYVQDWRDFGAELVKHILEESVMWAVSPSGYPRAELMQKLEKKLNRRLEFDDTGFGSTQLECSLKSVPTWKVREWFRFTGGHVWIEKKGSDWDLHLTDASFRAFLVLAGDVPRAAAKQATRDMLKTLPI
jgi:hypothetical protein